MTMERDLAAPRGMVSSRRYIRGSVGNLGTGETTILTCPGLLAGRIDVITAFNPTAGALVLTLHIVPAGGSAGTTNEIVEQSIAANAALDITWAKGIELKQGDIISGKGDSAGLNVWASAEVVEPSN